MQALLDLNDSRPLVPSSLYGLPELYDCVVSGPCEPFYIDAATASDGRVLELGCGSGRVALALAGNGLEVTGLDLSSPMLASAAEKADRKGLPITLVPGDMRRFELGDGSFDTVLASINTLLHLESLAELRSCLECVHRHLSPNGVFAFDVFNPRVERLAWGDERRLVGRFPAENGDEVTLEESMAYDPVSQVLRGTLFFSSPRHGEFHSARMDLRCIFPEELVLLLAATGFELVERYGGFAREPFTGESPHQVCVARPV